MPDTEAPGDVLRPLFQEPSDGLGDRDWTSGALLVALGTYSAYEWIEAAPAFRTAADRLLDSAISARVGWEASRVTLTGLMAVFAVGVTTTACSSLI